MLGDFAPLSSSLLQPGTSYHYPTQEMRERIGLADPALDVMTDLRRVTAIIIQPNETIDEARKRMIECGVRLLLVLDTQRKVVGLITATDILGEKPTLVVSERGCRRQDVLVGDIMTPQARLEVLDIRDVQHACVGHIVATLQKTGRQHAMVVEVGGDGRQIVRGLFSATQIARQLGVAIEPDRMVNTFSEIEMLLAH
ncbi:MAG TPA: CBS domain-containing protein [Burkholderiales bacterium]|nr:CBS domain-containing protein [Burkholderiales bacterium]